jgi:succinate---hydroxymethylglutarate CoA-transferase
MLKRASRWPFPCYNYLLCSPPTFQSARYSPFVPLQGRAESSTSATHPKPQGVLSGIKILDLTRVLAGPFCTQILASYGASVLKVEQPGTGDETRQWRAEGEASFWRDPPAKTPVSCYFAAVNCNKRSLTLNLKQEKGRDIALQLAKDADVVVNNFLPGKMEELGLGYDVLRTANPGLVYASISGYGATGPDAKRAGYDAVVAAEAGLLHITGESNDRPPVKPGVAIADLCTGLYMHGAIVAALLARERNGGIGQMIEGSLFESSLSLLTSVASAWMNLGREGGRWGLGHPSLVPYGGFKTKGEGWLFVAANNNRQWQALCEKLGDVELASDERFASNDGRVKHRAELVAAVQEHLHRKTLEEWLEAFQGSRLPYGPVNNIERAISHPQTDARRMVESVDFEAAADGVLKLLGLFCLDLRLSTCVDG